MKFLVESNCGDIPSLRDLMHPDSARYDWGGGVHFIMTLKYKPPREGGREGEEVL